MSAVQTLDGACALDCRSGRAVVYALHVEPAQPRLFEGNVLGLCAECTAWWRETLPADIRSVRLIAPASSPYRPLPHTAPTEAGGTDV